MIKTFSLITLVTFLLVACSHSDDQMERSYITAGFLVALNVHCELPEQMKKVSSALDKFENQHVSDNYSPKEIRHFEGLYIEESSDWMYKLSSAQRNDDGKHLTCNSKKFLANEVDDFYICIYAGRDQLCL